MRSPGNRRYLQYHNGSTVLPELYVVPVLYDPLVGQNFESAAQGVSFLLKATLALWLLYLGNRQPVNTIKVNTVLFCQFTGRIMSWVSAGVVQW